MFVHLGHRRGKLLVEFGYENQSSEGEVVGHADEQKNAANKMATTLPNQPVSEVPTAVASAVTCADCPSAAGTVTFTAHMARRLSPSIRRPRSRPDRWSHRAPHSVPTPPTRRRRYRRRTARPAPMGRPDRSRRASRRRHHHLSAELISRVFMIHVLFGRAVDFSESELTAGWHPPPIAMYRLWEDDEVVRRRRRDAAPHTTEADHVCTKHHHPGAALVH